VAIVVAGVTNQAYVAGTNQLEAPTITIEAPMPSTTADSYAADAASGHGDADTATIAGSLALTVLTIDREAMLGSGATLTADCTNVTCPSGSHDNVTLTSASNSSSEVKATSDEHVFNPQGSGVITGGNTINLPYKIKDDSGNPIANGAKLDYSNGGDTSIGGLVDNGQYYAENVNTTATGMSFQLAATQSDATSGIHPLALTPSVATGAEHSLKLDGGVNGVGIGASFAIDIVNDTTNAVIYDGAALTGANNLTLTSNTTDAMDTEAENGAEGKTAINPSVAISISNVTTNATVGQTLVTTPPTLTLAGALDAEATQSASVTTIAKGDVTSSSVGAGASIAITDANHSVTATTFYNVSAAGAITLKATSASGTDSETRASVAGADTASGDGGSNGDSNNVNQQANAQLGQANSTAGHNGAGTSKDASTPNASTADNGGGGDGSSAIGVAASISFNLIHATANASLPEGPTVSSGGLLTMDSSANTDATAKADGEAATQDGSASIGAAVAINLAYVNNTANITAGDSVSSDGLSLGAIMNPTGTAGAESKPTHTFLASATSGAQGSQTANINGSLALNIIEVNTSAALTGADGIRGPPTVSVGGANVSMTGTSTTSSTTNALAANSNFNPNAAGVITADKSGDPLNTIYVTEAITRKDGSPIQTGDPVIYHDGGGSPIGATDPSDSSVKTLKDGTTYYVVVVKPGYYELATTAANATASTPTVLTLDPTKATGTDHSLELTGSNAGDSKVGIGASVAINLVNDTTQTGTVGGTSSSPGATLTGAQDIVLASTTGDSLSSDAEGGAEGGVAIAPSVVVAIPNVTTTASFDAGPAITATGKIDATATQDAEVDSTAKGDFTGSKVGIGISLVVNVPTDVVNAGSARSLSSGSTTGDDEIALEADGSSYVNGETEAAGEGETSSSDSGSKDSSGSENVNQKADNQLGAAESTQSGADGGKTSSTSKTPEATTGDNGGSSLSLAGAITINVVNTSSTATFASGTTISAGGGVSLKTTANTDSLANANGDTKTKTSVGIGAAISINVTNIVNKANTGGATVSANGIDIEAGVPVNAHDPVWVYNTSAPNPSWQLVASGTALPTKPNNNDYFDLTAPSGLNAAGVYQYNSTSQSWGSALTVSQVASLPTTNPSSTTLDQAAAHQVYAVATSGASAGSDLVIAGSLAMNIVTNDTEAVLGAGGGTVADSAGTGNVTLSAYNNEVDVANAKATADGGSEKQGSGDSSSPTESAGKDSQGNSVGVGASVALNILTSTKAEAAIENGVALSGGANVTLTATSTRLVQTNVEAGTSGGQDGISPAVSLVVLDGDSATAQIGSSGTALSATGAVTVQATHSIDASGTEGSADAAGSSVAVGADISINVIINWSTDAELDRSAGAPAGVSITASSNVNSGSSTKASAKGSSNSSSGADSTANNQVANNPNASGTGVGTLPSSSSATSGANGSASSESGDSGGGVGVAAAISVDWVQTTNTASIANGATVTATNGPVSVEAIDQTTATSKAIGLAASLQESDADVAAAVGFNYQQISNTATVGTGVTIGSSGLNPGITVAAITPNGAPNNFIVWGIAGAGGQNDASVAAAIGVQVLSYNTTASVGAGSTLTSGGGVTVNASDPIGLQNVSASAALSVGGVGVGGAISVNVISSDTTQAYIDSGTTAGTVTTVNAAGELDVTAGTSLSPLVPNLSSLGINNSSLPFTLPSLSSIALGAAAGSGDAAVTGSFIVDVFSFDTEAHINNGAQVNQSSGYQQGSSQKIKVTATDSNSIVNVAGGLALSSGDAGVGVGVTVDVLTTTTVASIGSSANVYAGGDVTVSANQTESYFGLSIEGSASGEAGVSGAVVVVVLNGGSSQGTCTGGADGTCAEIGSSTALESQGGVNVTASDTATNLNLSAGQISIGGSAGVGASVVTLVRNQNVDAGIAANASVTGLGSSGVAVGATQTVSPTLIAIGGSGGGDAAVAGSVAVDVMTDNTTAHVDSGATVCTTTTCTTPSAAGPQNVAVTASDTTNALDTVGTLAIGGDAGVGAGVDVQVISKTTESTIGALTDVQANGSVIDTATSSEKIMSISVGAAIGGDAGIAVNAGVSVFTVKTEASIGNFATVQASDSVNVAANEALNLDVITGNITGSGAVAVGATAAVPIVNKTTEAWIGSNADVNALGNGSTGVTVNSGAFNVSTVDTRFDPGSAIEAGGTTINLGYTDGFTENEAVRYDNGGGANIQCTSCSGGRLNGGDTSASSGATVGSTYYVHVVSPTEIQLMAAPNGTILTGLSAPTSCTGASSSCVCTGSPSTCGGESQRFVGASEVTAPTDDSPRFNPATDVAGNVIILPYMPDFVTGDEVVYSAGGGTPIGGLTDGGEYYACVSGGGNQVALEASTATSCNSAHYVTLSGGATGRSHSLVKKGDEPSANASAENASTVSAGTTSGFHGVAVTATNSDNIAAVAISAGGAGSVAVNVSGAVNVVNATTLAYIGQSAHVNCNLTDSTCTNNVANAGANQSVDVAAGDSFQQLGIAGSLAVGGDVGVAPGASVRVATITTKAYIDNSAVVHANNTIAIQASGNESLVSVAVSVGGGTVGVAASVSVSVMHVTTYADTGAGTTLDSAGNVLLSAADQTGLISVAGSVGGGFVGASAGVGVASITKDTEAYIGAGSTVNAGGGAAGLSGIRNGSAGTGCTSANGCFGSFSSFTGVAVQSASSENVFGLAIAVGGGFVGVAGAVGVTIANVTTEAYIGSGANVDATGGSVNVAAVDYAKTLTIGGGVAGGFVGVGGGVDIGVLDQSVLASIGAGATVDAAGDVDVYALEHQDLQTYAVGLAGGAVGVAGAVSVWTVGTTPTSTYSESGTAPTVYSASSHYKAGDAVTYNNVEYVAKKDNPTATPGTDATQWEVQQDALNNGQGGTGPSSTADGEAGGQGGGATPGYMTILNGASNSTPPASWSNTATYHKGDYVSFNGHDYQANLDNPDSNIAPDMSGANHWTLNGAYNSGDIVIYNGVLFQAKNTIAHSTTSPVADPTDWAPTSQWTNVDGEYMTNSRISSVTGSDGGTCSSTDKSASGQLVCSQTNGSLVSGDLGATPTPQGTSAEIYGSVAAQGSVNVVANDHLSLSGLAGALAGGFVGVGAGILVVNIGGSTDAGINSGASVSAGPNGGTCGSGGDCVTVSATGTESVNALAIAGTLGAIALGGAVAVVNDSNSQNAHIDGTASIPQAAGGIVVQSTATRTATVLTPQVSIAGIAAGAAVAVLFMNGNDTASIGDVQVGSGGTVGAITVTATDNLNPSTEAVAVDGGVGGAIAGAVAWTDLSGSTVASSGAWGTVGSGGMTVTATGDHSDVNASSINVAVGAGLAAGLTIRHAVDDRSTEANTTASATPGAALSTTGAVSITAQAINAATAQDVGPNITIGGLGISVIYGIAEVGGATRVQLDGNVSKSSSITALAYGENSADAPVFQLGASVLGIGGIYSDAEITSGAGIEVLVNSDASLSSSGAVCVEAQTAGAGSTAGSPCPTASDPVTDTATSSVTSVSFGVALNVTVMVSQAIVNGDVKATLDGTVSSSSSITVSANGANNAGATTTTANLSLGAAISGAGASADIGKGAVTQASAGSSSSLSSSGAIQFTANSNNVAKGVSDGGTGGLVAIGISFPSGTVEGATNASIGGNVTGTSAGVSATATSANSATATSFVVAVGLGAGAGSDAQASVTGDAATVACGGVFSSGACSGSGTWNVPGGAVSFSAGSNNTSTAKAKGIGVGVVSISVMETSASVGGPTDAGFDATLDATTTAAGSLTVQATAQNVATADTNVDSGGAFSINAPSANSDITAQAGTYATLGSNADVNVTGQVLVEGNLASDGTAAGNCAMSGSCGCQNGAGSCSSAFAHGGSGGIISGGLYQAQALGEAPVTAEMGGKVMSAGSVVIDANGASDVEADTQSLNIGGVSFSADLSDAQVNSTATTQALVDQGASASTTRSATGSCGADAGTDICVEATSANTANAFSDGATIGLIAVGAGLPTAIVDAGTKAYYDGSVGTASGVTVIANSANSADATSSVLSAGLVGADGSLAQACIGQQTGNGPDYCQSDSAFTDAIVGPDAQLGQLNGTSPSISGQVTVSAQATNDATASSSGSAFGLVSVSVTDPTAADYGSTEAELLGNVGSRHIGPNHTWVGDAGAGAVLVTATAGDITQGQVSTEGGGLVAASASTATASTNPLVTAELGGGHVTATGNVTVLGTSHTDAGAYSNATQGGFVNLQVGLTSNSSVNPAVNATVNGGFVQAGGTITISASHGSEPQQYSDGTISNVTGNTLTFNGLTGLNNGDAVTYEEPGSGNDTSDNNANSIPGLNDGNTYGVIVTGPDTVELGAQFTFGQTTPGPNGSITEVNTAAATLQFVVPDNLHTGDLVDYNPGSGNSPILEWVGGTLQDLPAGEYIVEVVNPTTIRLTDFFQEFFNNRSAGFGSGSVSGNTFNLGGFNANDPLTYEAPQVAQFDGNNVDVIPDGGSPDAPEQCGSSPCRPFFLFPPNGNIYAPGYTFSTGDQVVYGCQPLSGQNSCSGVGGLTLGDTYTVIGIDSSFLELDPAGDTNTNDVIELNPGGSGIQTLTPVNTSAVSTFDGVAGIYNGSSTYIYDPGAGFTAGEQVDYGCQGSCSAVGGLTPGDIYTVIPYLPNGDYFQLDPAGTTDPNQVIFFTPGSGTQALTPVDEGIGGLVNGDTYYVDPTGSNQFELTNLPGIFGSVVSIDAGSSSGTSHLSIDGIPLAFSGSGTQQLIEVLGTPPGAPGTMLGVGAIRALLGANDVGTASSSGVGGGFVNVQNSESNASVTPTVNATISAGSILSGNDVVISAAAAANAVASSSNAGGGFVSVGSSNATATTNNVVTTQVAGGASVTAVEDVQLFATSTEDPVTDSEIGGGGVYAGSDSHATSNSNHQDLVEISGTVNAGRTVLAEGREGFNGSLVSKSDAAGLGASSHANQDGEAVNIGSGGSSCGSVSTLSGAGGCAVAGTIVSGSIQGQTIYLSGEVGLQHVLDSNGNVILGTLDLLVTMVQVNGVTATANASSHADALGAGSDATAAIYVSEVQGVELDLGANLSAATIQLHARAENQNFNTSSDAYCGCGGGHAGANSPLGYNSNSLVNGQPGSTLSTATLLVDTYQTYGWSSYAHSHGGAFVSHDSCAGSCGSTANNQDRNIVWNSTTFLLGDADPVLTINQAGTIVALSGPVSVYTNSSDSGAPLQIGSTISPGQTIYVAPILNTAQPAVLFEANQINGGPVSQISSFNSSADMPSLFIVQDTFGSVTVINQSDRPMVMQGTGGPASLSIDTVNTNLATNAQAVINISVDNGEQLGGGFNFGIKQLFVPTTVLVESIRGPPTTGFPLTFQGGIYNPLGSMTLRSDRGDIVVATTGQFTGNALSVTATDGSVGCATTDPSCTSSDTLNAVLVEYGTGPLGSSPTAHAISVQGEAYDDLNLTLTYAERYTNVLSSADVTPVISSLHAGRNLIVNVLDSYQGVNQGTVGGINVAGFNPDSVPATPWTTASGSPFEVVPTIEHFQPDPANPTVWICSTETANCFQDAYVLIAFGTDQTTVNSDYTFTDLTAGNDIFVDHGSTATRVTMTASTYVDGTFTDPNGQTVGSHNNAGNASLYTNGSILDTETSGNLRVGQIIASGTCTGGASLCGSTPIPADVTLRSPAAVLNASGDGYVPQQTPTAVGTNTIARNITITAGNNGLAGGISGQGGVGTPDLFLTVQVNADGLDAAGNLGVLTVTDTQAGHVGYSYSSIPGNLPPAGGGTYGVFITQTNDNGSNGNMEVNTVITSGDATLTTTGGSILDARNNGAGVNTLIAPPNVIADNVDLQALSGSIGAVNGSNDLKVYSSAGPGCTSSYTFAYQGANYQNATASQRAVTATCHLAAQADGSVYITETPGVTGVAAPADVLLALARNGNVRITTTDTGPQGNDIALLNSGDTLVVSDHPQVVSNGLIEAQSGNVTLITADDMATDPNSQILATTESHDPGTGNTAAANPSLPVNQTGNISIYGDYHPGLSSTTPGIGTTIILRGTIIPGAGGGLTRVFGNVNADTIIFDQTYLGGQTRAYGSDLPTLPGQFAPAGDGTGAACTTGCDDTFIVNRLQSMIALGQDVATGYTLTLDGQSGANTYNVYTSGSQFTQNNYTINVLGTHAPTDGTDTLNIYGYDSYTANTPNNTGINPATGQNYATNDLFLLRSTPYITSETAARPSLYQGTGDCSAPDSSSLAGTTAAICSGGAAFVALEHATVNQAQSSDSQGYLINNGTTGIFGVERINYDSATNGGLHVYSIGGNDYFASDDNAAATYIDGGQGNNTFQIGQLYGLQRTSSGTYSGNLAAENVFAFATIATVDGWLSRGNSSPMTVQGGTGNNTFVVYSNQAPLSLQGEGGNNTFTVRAFALAQTDSHGNMIFPGGCNPNTTPSCLPTPLTTPTQGDGDNDADDQQIAYNFDAPVSVDGGSGHNQLTIVATEYQDHFVLVGQSILGAGLSVGYNNIQSIELNTHQGGDTVDVLSTAPGVSVGIMGGQRDDVNVDCGCSGGENGQIDGNVYAVNPNGTSAVINQSILTYAQWCQDLTIPGVSLSVAQATDGPVVITQPVAGLSVSETGSGPIGTVASYDVRLAQQPNCGAAPSCTVYVTITAELGTLLQRTGSPLGDSLLLALGANPSPGTTTASSAFYQHVVINGVPVDIPQRALVLVFNSSNWNIPQVVSVGAMNTPLPSATQVYELSSSVLSADPVFDNAGVSNVAVTKVGSGAPAIIVSNIGNTDTPGLYGDGVGNGTTTFASLSASFTSSDLGQAIIETDGRGLLPAGTTIVAVVNATTVTLSQVVAKGTCIVFALPSRVTPPANFSNGVANGTSTFTSATANFTLNDLGQPLVETDGGGHIPAGDVIIAVNGPTSVTLSQAVSAASGIAFELPTRLDGFTSYRDGASTAGSTTFTSATAAFNAGDIGRPIVETDIGAVFAPNTVILAVINSTTVTLSAAALSTASGVAFALPARNANNLVLAGSSTTGIVDYYSITLATKPTGTVILDINPGYPVTLSSSDSRFVQLSPPWYGQQPGCYQVTFTPANWNVPVVIAVTATSQYGQDDQTQQASINPTVDWHSTAAEYHGVSTSSSPLVVQVAGSETGAIVQTPSNMIVTKCGNTNCTLPGPGSSYTVRLTEPPQPGLTVVMATDGQTFVMPGGQVIYQNINQAWFSGIVTYSTAAGTLTLSGTCNNSWTGYGFAVGQLFQINGTGSLYKIQSITGTSNGLSNVLTVTSATLNQLTGAETVAPLPFSGTGSVKMTLSEWAATISFNCNNWWAPVTVAVFADPYFKDPAANVHQIEFPSGPLQLSGACGPIFLQPGVSAYTGIPPLPVMLPVEKNAEPFGFPDIPPTPTLAINPSSVTGLCSPACTNDYVTNINNPSFIVTDADPAATISIYVNGVLYTGQHLADGTYCVTAVATNPLGFHSPAVTLAKLLLIDTTAPAGSFTVSGGKTINGQVSTTSKTPTLQLSFSDCGSGIYSISYSINGGSFSAVAANASQLPVSLAAGDGLYTIVFRVTDCAGNVYTDTQTVRLDTTGPAITASLSAPQNTMVANSYDGSANIVLSVGATDVSTVCSTTTTLDGAKFSGTSINIYSLAAGTHTLVVTSVDGLGNSSSTTLTFSIDPSLVGVEDLVKYGYSAGLFSSSIQTALLGYLTSTSNSLATDLTNFKTAVAADSTCRSPTISTAEAALLTGWATYLAAGK